MVDDCFLKGRAARAPLPQRHILDVLEASDALEGLEGYNMFDIFPRFKCVVDRFRYPENAEAPTIRLGP